MSRKSLISVGLIILLAACSPTPPGTTTVTAVATQTVYQVIPPTQAPTATLTPAPPQPTPTPALTATSPSATSTAAAQRVLAMQAGATETSTSGHLDANQQSVYTFTAQAGQYLETALTTTDPSLTLAIATPDNQPLVKTSDQKQSWQGFLPTAGIYQVVVAATSAPGDYSLVITIPVVVKFALGATSITLNGAVANQQVTSYMVKAEKGQTLSVNINSQDKDVFLTIYGVEDGQPYLRSMMGLTSASIKLPVTQDYMVQCVSNGAADETFKLTISAQ